MNDFTIHVCTICGREKTKPGWFLIAGNRWGDRLKILQWNDRLAAIRGVHEVCSADHARELVVHWMRMGSLSYPFAKTQSLSEWPSQKIAQTEKNDPDVSGAQQLGELYLHRESIGRILDENPRSLTLILDALVFALRPQKARERDVEDAEITADLQSVGQ